MATSRTMCMLRLILCLGFYICATTSIQDANDVYCGLSNANDIHRSDFPSSFIFGVSSSSYQYEGAVNEGGNGATNYDRFAHTPGNVRDGSTADVTEDQYHRYKEDIDLMRELGVDYYRFAISWSRIFPEGRHFVNKEGIAYYNDLIDGLLEKGIRPIVTINHVVIPQALQDEGGWLNPKMIEDYANYANTCFATFGDRVKDWITINSPRMCSNVAFNVGITPPNRCSPDVGNCENGNSSTEPYIVGHHYLLAHTAATNIYKTKYQAHQHGRIGITLDARWFEPLTANSEDRSAARRALEFEIGWFMHPLIFGSYPGIMRDEIGDRLPKFTMEESLAIKGSANFIGINYFTAWYAAKGLANSLSPEPLNVITYYKDIKVLLTDEHNGTKIGANRKGQHVAPWALRKLLEHIKLRYNNPLVIITENGVPDADNTTLGPDNVLDDSDRIEFLGGYLSCLSSAIRDGSNVAGYFIWSLLDNWEWMEGFTIKYGLYRVDFEYNLQRYPKQSAYWYKRFLKREETISVS